MSIINQVLLDLERRRASSAERGALPDHVRALPDSRDNTRAWRYAAVTGAVAVILLAWIGWTKFDLRWRTPERSQVTAEPSPVAPRPAPAVVTPVPVADTDTIALSSRLSLELSSAPAAPSEPVPAARVLEKEPERLPRAAKPEAPATPPRIARPDREPKAAPVEKPAAIAQTAPGGIDKKILEPTRQQLADTEFGNATTLMRQGRAADARALLEAALRHSPSHAGARQTLVGLLIDAQQYAEAERVLQEGLQLSPAQIGFAVTLARVQVDRGNLAAAVDTLQKSLEYARATPDYLAFYAALLQRQQRHDEAVEQFQAALRLRPQSGVWLLGMGVSLQALGRGAEAQDVYRRAKASGSLTPELGAFVDQRLQ